MISRRPTAMLIFLGLYSIVFVTIIVLRGLTAETLIAFVLQAIAGVGTLHVLTVQTAHATSVQIDGYYTTAANALIGFGMVLSAFTILRAANGLSSASQILSVAPTALAATATGLVGGTFFFVLGHIRAEAASTRVAAVAAQPDVQRELVFTLRSIADGLFRQDRALDRMSSTLEMFAGVVTSTEGQSWNETQARLLEPLHKVSDALPALTTALQQSTSATATLARHIPGVVDALASNTSATAASNATLQKIGGVAMHVANATGANTTAMREVADACNQTGEAVKTASAGVSALLRATEGVVAEAVETRRAADAATEAHDRHTEALEAHRGTLESYTATLDKNAQEVREKLAVATEALAQLRAAMTTDQRSLLTVYLEGLGSSAAKIAEDVLRQVPQHLDKLLSDVEQRILSKVEQAFDHAYRGANDRFKSLNESVGITAERLSTVSAELKHFNAAFNEFERCVREGATETEANATAFTNAASQLADATRRFSEAVARTDTPEQAPLLAALRETVNTIAASAREFTTAQVRVEAEQEQLRKQLASLTSIRLEGARLRVKADGTA